LSTSAKKEIEAAGISVLAVARERRIGAHLLGRYSGRMNSFLPSERPFAEILASARRFQPDVVVADGVDLTLPARHLASMLGVKLAYRSQNVEHAYWREQGRLARGRARLPFSLGNRGFARAERELRDTADLVMDISEEDRLWWPATSGRGNAVVVPPVWLPSTPQSLTTTPTWDVSFTGGLSAPNNVEGLRWLRQLVWPVLVSRLGRQPRVLIAGSHPQDEAREIAASMGATLIPNPDSLDSLRRDSRVLVNPVRFSSGVNIKMIEMLAIGRPIISTMAGVRGLPEELRRLVCVADTAEGFAEAILTASSQDLSEFRLAASAALERHCGLSVLYPLMDLASQAAVSREKVNR
jgi:glycosyltransferase involved in cell wall biosynthesis